MGQRRANIDLLRVFAMYGIVLFHHFGVTVPNHFVELRNGFTEDSFFYDMINNIPGAVSKLSLLMDFCYGHFGNGGNFIFMLVTGYFLFGRRSTLEGRVRSVGRILYAIVFYGVVLTVINFAMLRAYHPIDGYEWFKPLFTLPNWLSGDNLWYLQAYGIFLLVILPVLKLFEDKLTKSRHASLCLLLAFLYFLAYATYLPNLFISRQLLYFTMCYYMGGYVARYGVKIGRRALLGALATYIVLYLLYEFYWRYSNAVMYAPNEYSYIPVMEPFACCLVYAVLCFLLFSGFQMRGGRLAKVLESISSSTVGIYIFHVYVLEFSFIIANSSWWHDWSQGGFFVFALLDSLLLMTVACLVDVLRKQSMRWLEARLLRPADEAA